MTLWFQGSEQLTGSKLSVEAHFAKPSGNPVPTQQSSLLLGAQ